MLIKARATTVVQVRSFAMRENSKAFTDGAGERSASEGYRKMISDNLCQSRSDGFRQE